MQSKYLEYFLFSKESKAKHSNTFICWFLNGIFSEIDSMVSGYFPHYTNVVNAFPFDCMHKNGEFVLISMDSHAWRTNVTGKFNQGFCACRFVSVSVGVFAERKKAIKFSEFLWILQNVHIYVTFERKLWSFHPQYYQIIITKFSFKSIFITNCIFNLDGTKNTSIYFDMKILCAWILLCSDGNYLVDRVYYWNI